MKPTTLRCSQGDCCVLTRSKVPENVGRIVRVLRRDKERGKDWEVVSLGSPLVGVDDEGKLGKSMRLFVLDCQLRTLFASWPSFLPSK